MRSQCGKVLCCVCWCAAGAVQLLTSFFTVYFFYWALPITTGGYGLENDLGRRRRRNKRRRKQTKRHPHPPSAVLYFLSTVFHLNHCTPLGESRVSRCRCRLSSPLLGFLLYGCLLQLQGGEEGWREEGSSPVTQCSALPTKVSLGGYHVQILYRAQGG